MNKERWELIQRLFGQVVDMEQAEQLTWLQENCNDSALGDEVISL